VENVKSGAQLSISAVVLSYANELWEFLIHTVFGLSKALNICHVFKLPVWHGKSEWRHSLIMSIVSIQGCLSMPWLQTTCSSFIIVLHGV